MSAQRERRGEPRLQYEWPAWYSGDVELGMDQGLMVDVSSAGIAFTCHADERCPQSGQELTVRFSLPRFDQHGQSGTVRLTRTGQVCRVEHVSKSVRRIAVEFDEPLSLHPTEQTGLAIMRHAKP